MTKSTKNTYLLLTHRANDGDQNVLTVLESGLDLLTELALGDLHVVLGGTVGRPQVQETLVDVDLRIHEIGVPEIPRGQKQPSLTSWYSSLLTCGTSML